MVNHTPFLYTTELESVATLCFRAFDGSNYEVRCAVANLLGNLIACTQQPAKPGLSLQAAKSLRPTSLDEAFGILMSGFLRGGVSFLKGTGEMIKGSSGVNREVRVGVTHVSRGVWNLKFDFRKHKTISAGVRNFRSCDGWCLVGTKPASISGARSGSGCQSESCIVPCRCGLFAQVHHIHFTLCDRQDAWRKGTDVGLQGVGADNCQANEFDWLQSGECEGLESGDAVQSTFVGVCAAGIGQFNFEFGDNRSDFIDGPVAQYDRCNVCRSRSSVFGGSTLSCMVFKVFSPRKLARFPRNLQKKKRFFHHRFV